MVTYTEEELELLEKRKPFYERIIRANHPYKMIWDCLIMFIALLICLLVPFDVAWDL